MSRKPEPPPGFDCLYKDACPHLRGYSTTWALHCVKDHYGSACENGQHLIIAEKEIEVLGAENLKLREENARLKSNAKVIHKSLATTERYLYLSINDLKEAHRKFHPREWNELTTL